MSDYLYSVDDGKHLDVHSPIYIHLYTDLYIHICPHFQLGWCVSNQENPWACQRCLSKINLHRTICVDYIMPMIDRVYIWLSLKLRSADTLTRGYDEWFNQTRVQLCVIFRMTTAVEWGYRLNRWRYLDLELVSSPLSIRVWSRLRICRIKYP